MRNGLHNKAIEELERKRRVIVKRELGLYD